MKFLIFNTKSADYHAKTLLENFPWMNTYEWIKKEKINFLNKTIEVIVIEGNGEKIFNAMKDMATDFKKELAIDFEVNKYLGLPTIEIIDDYRE